MQNNDISKLDDIHSLDELHAIREEHRKEAEAIKRAEARIQQEERAKRRQQDQEFKQNLTEEIYGFYSLSHGSCEMIVDRVWDSHHSYGTQEVSSAAYSLADFVEQIVHNEYPNQ